MHCQFSVFLLVSLTIIVSGTIIKTTTTTSTSTTTTTTPKPIIICDDVPAFTCVPDDYTKFILEGTTLKCAPGQVCNSKNISPCSPCIEPKPLCDYNFTCGPEPDTVQLMGTVLHCDTGLICNANYEPPCNWCITDPVTQTDPPVVNETYCDIDGDDKPCRWKDGTSFFKCTVNWWWYEIEEILCSDAGAHDCKQSDRYC